MQFNPVAIIAADCILPGASNIEEFYRNNEEACSSIRHARSEFWASTKLYNSDASNPGQSYTDLGGFLDPWKLNTLQLRIPPRLLENIEPIHKLGLEVARRVISHCEGSMPLPHQETAVILANISAGMKTRADLLIHLENQKWAQHASKLLPEESDSIYEYASQIAKQFPHAEEDAGINGEASTLAGRIANYFNFLGPHYCLDSACASSLTALHAACIGLHQGDFQAALVGAVGLLVPETFVICSQAKSLSTTGCFPFDERADGMVTAEGCIMVMLMPLNAARKAGYPIKGVIRSIGYSCNGRTAVSWGTSVDGEVQAIKRAFEQVPFDYTQVDYIEAHGTSTPLGDATELEAMLATYGSKARSTSLPFGSVKSMVGHMAEGAGLAAILRALFVFERHKLPPTINIKQPLARLSEPNCPLHLQTEIGLCPSSPNRPRRVGVNTFGYGGINYHALVEEDYPSAPTAIPMLQPPKREPIAIVALSSVVPDAPDSEVFWQNLCSGHVSLHDLRTYIPLLDTFLQPTSLITKGIYLDRAAIVERPVFTDFRMFRILPKLLDKITTEQLLLMKAIATLVHQLGERFTRIDSSKAGCLIGYMTDGDPSGYYFRSIRFPVWFEGLAKILMERGLSSSQIAAIEKKLWKNPDLQLEELSEDTSISFGGSMLASRIAAGLDFRGKSYVVRAVCATGLAVVSLGMQELRQHTLDFVICGATSLGLDIANQASLASMHAISHKGQGRPYDREGDGFVVGSGACAVALKRLSDAERDQDDIIAVIQEVCGGSDGKGYSLLAPNVSGRQTTMRRVYERSELAPQTVQYVEGHGASTSVGDKAEIDALAEVLKNERTVYIGCVKGNIGHLKAGAGLAALIKTALCLRHRLLVPSGGYSTPNPDLQLAQRHMTVLTQTMPWPSNGNEPRRAAINSFGLAGNNYHALLEEYIPSSSTKTKNTSVDHNVPSQRKEALSSNPKQVALWTAYSKDDLIQKLQRYLDSGQCDGEIQETDSYRVAIQYDDAELLILSKRVKSLLQALNEKKENPFELEPLGIFYCWREKRPQGRICYLFPGQGSQYEGMARQLQPSIRGLLGIVAKAAGTLRKELPDFYRYFWLEDLRLSRDWLANTTNCQVATLTVSRILSCWLGQLGIRPDMLLGHSFGEMVALIESESITYEDGLHMAYWRGKFAEEQTQLQAHAMAVLFTSPEQFASLFEHNADQVFLANHNSNTQVVISGMKSAVEHVLQIAEQQHIDGRLLPISRAFHSPLMAPVVSLFRDYLQAIPMSTPCIPLYQNVSAGLYRTDVSDKDLRESMAQQYVTRVDYVAMIKDAYAQGARIFIEVGPKRALTDLAKEILAPDTGVFVPLIHPKGGELQHLQRSWARLWVYGITNIVPDAIPSSLINKKGTIEKQQKAAVLQRELTESVKNASSESLPITTQMVGMVPEVCSASAFNPTLCWEGKKVVIVADMSGLANELVSHLQQAGAVVEVFIVRETIVPELSPCTSGGIYINLTELSDHLTTSFSPDWLFFLPGYSLGHKRVSSLHPYETIYMGGIFAVLRQTFAILGKKWQQFQQECGIVVVTRSDGRFGHTQSQRNNPLGRALYGALRAMQMELPGLRTSLIDVDPFTTSQAIAPTVLKIVSSTVDHLEIAIFGQERVQTVLCPIYHEPESIPGSSGALPLNLDSTVVVTGGARGVTAKVVEALAKEIPCRYIIIGKTEPIDVRAALGISSKEALLALSAKELHEHKMNHFKVLRKIRKDLTPVQFEKHWNVVEKSLEITRTIARLKDTGATIEYVSLDITDAFETRTFCQRLINSGYRIEGLIHGAGVEKSKLVWDQNPEQWDQTLAVKTVGITNLLSLLGPATRMVLLFSSIAGTFGGYGQTDYSSGSEYLNHLAYRLSADLPHARVRSIAWPAWNEVGLAMRETTQLYFKAMNLQYMSVSEGVRWALCALRSPYYLPELIVSYRNMPTEMCSTRHIAHDGHMLSSQYSPLIQSVYPVEHEDMETKWTYDPQVDYYLHDHRVNGHARLPAVHFIEHILEAIASLHPDTYVTQIDALSIDAPCVLNEDRRRPLFVKVVPSKNPMIYVIQVYSYPILPDNTWVPQRIVLARAQVTVASSPRRSARIQIHRSTQLAFDAERVRQWFAQLRVEYGPSFTGLGEFYAHPDYAYCATLRVAEKPALQESSKSFYSVPLLDLACQSLAYFFKSEAEGGLPVGFDRIKIFATEHPAQQGYALASRYSEKQRLDLTITDTDGNVVMMIEGMRVQQPAQNVV